MAWNRKKTIEFCNENIFPKVDYRAWTHCGNELMEVVKVVENYRRSHNFPQDLVANVVDGFLYLNGDPVERIAMALNKPTYAYGYSARGNYYEGRILARNETEYDF